VTASWTARWARSLQQRHRNDSIATRHWKQNICVLWGRDRSASWSPAYMFTQYASLTMVHSLELNGGGLVSHGNT